MIYAPDYQNIPYWWEAAPRQSLTQTDLVRTVDVAVIGSGYTGLNAALQTARAGRTTLVLEKDLAGCGCSSRNGGQIGTSFKPSLSSLEKKFGRETAIRMIQEGHSALNYVTNLIQEENIDCDLSQTGRFVGTHTKKAFNRLAKQHQDLPSEIKVEYHMVPRAELRQEIDSDYFHGGCILPAHGSLHPGKYHQGLLERVLESGAMVVDQCEVSQLEKKTDGFRLHTNRGSIDAANVILATNGYTKDQFGWHNKRILPIGSFQIATELLPDETAAKLIPNARVMSDTQLIGNYFRLSPDRRRLIFGGRVTFTEANSEAGTKVLYEQMTKIYPQLKGIKVSYAWVGFVAYTTDISPHIGVQDGVHYAMGYCGSGITLSSYLGMRVGQKVLGADKGLTDLDKLNFRPWPSIIQNKLVLGVATRLTRVAENFI